MPSRALQREEMSKSTTASQKQAPSESALVAAGSSTAAPDNTQELSPEESYGSMLKWFQKLGDDHDMTILDFFKSLHQATHPDTRDPSQCTTEQQAWMDEQAAEVFTSEMMDCLADAAAKMRMQDEAEVTGKSVEELALERVQPIIEAEMEALENCGHFRSSKNGSEADDFSLDKIQPLLEELAPNLFDILMGAVAGAREYDEEQPQGSTSTEDDDSEVSNARVVCSVIVQLLYARNEDCDRYRRHFEKQLLAQSADAPAEVISLLSSIGMFLPPSEAGEDASPVTDAKGKGKS